mmetsp:Transcript_41659/g.114974  ORF Transcript_41659/g.114974 Transcript_41659/m.114974 type:complete len:218 (-) Transcript_41659:183-836(-)
MWSRRRPSCTTVAAETRNLIDLVTRSAGFHVWDALPGATMRTPQFIGDVVTAKRVSKRRRAKELWRVQRFVLNHAAHTHSAQRVVRHRFAGMRGGRLRRLGAPDVGHLAGREALREVSDIVFGTRDADVNDLRRTSFARASRRRRWRAVRRDSLFVALETRRPRARITAVTDDLDNIVASRHRWRRVPLSWRPRHAARHRWLRHGRIGTTLLTGHDP